MKRTASDEKSQTPSTTLNVGKPIPSNISTQRISPEASRTTSDERMGSFKPDPERTRSILHPFIPSQRAASTSNKHSKTSKTELLPPDNPSQNVSQDASFLHLKPSPNPERMHKKHSMISYFKKRICKSCCTYEYIMTRIPVLKWFPTYKWKSYFVHDLISGFTIAVMHIPQGIAYAQLGNVPPIMGIYMAFFPVIIYFIFGTSRHASMGSFAIVCLMAGQVVSEYAMLHKETNDSTQSAVDPIGVAITVTFMVGVIAVVLFLCGMSVICSLLSKTYVSGFTTGAAVHVFTSQLKEIFGLKFDTRVGFMRVLLTFYDVVVNISFTNMVTLAISGCTVLVLVLYISLKQKLHKSRFFFPIELTVIIIGVIVSTYSDFVHDYNVNIVGEIPRGFPYPRAPEMSIVTFVTMKSFMITLVSYCTTMSMALLVSNRNNYKIDPSQELLALGLSNIVGSFFLCLPVSSSLSRTVMQEETGQTQLASIVSCVILLAVLLYFGPFLEPLPRSVLAAIIIVALRSLIFQIKHFLPLCRQSKIDGVIWLATFLSVILLDIGFGLFIGMLMTLVCNFVQSCQPFVCLIGRIPLNSTINNKSYIYVRFKKEIATEIPGIKIIKIFGSLNFATRHYIARRIYQLSFVDPFRVLGVNKVLQDSSLYSDTIEGMKEVPFYFKKSPIPGDPNVKTQKLILTHIILDIKENFHVDFTGLTVLKKIIDVYKQIGITVFIVSNNPQLSSHLVVDDLVDVIEKS